MNSKQVLRQARLQEWVARIQEQAQSGLTVNAWCDQYGISRNRFYYWKKALRDEYVDAMLSEIVPVPQLVVEAASKPQSDSDSLLYNLYNSDNKPTPIAPAESEVLYNSQKFDNKVHIILGDVDLAVGENVSDKRLLNLIKAVRHA